MIQFVLQKLLGDAVLVPYMTVPLVSMLLSAYTQTCPDKAFATLRPNACGDLFCFTLALDATLLITKDSVIQRVNPILAQNFVNYLVVMLLASVLMMIFSGRTQCRLSKVSRTRPYPLLAVASCWILGITFTAAHLYLLLGK